MSRFHALRLWVLVIVCASWACEKVPLTSPTGSTISLSTNSNIVPVNGSVDVTATVTESAGTAVQNGTTVIFTSDFGRMDPAEAKTQNGRATVRFVASGQSGTVKVNAYSGAASTSAGTTSGALTLLVGGAAAGRIAVRAEPPIVPQAGGTTQVFANVSDTNGNPLVGAPVTFTIGGTTGAGVLGSPSTVTDGSGLAQTSLTTNQTTTVTATVATTTTTSAVTANVVVTALPAPSIAITGCSASPAVGVPVNCTVTPTVPSGGSAIQNVTVNWGDGSGEQPYGNITSATIVSHTYTNPGTYSVTASATDLNSQRGTAVQALVVNRVLPNVVLTVPTTGTSGVAVAMSIAPASTQVQPITGVIVNFGDGTSRTFGSLASAQGFTKTYASAGGYTVTATATDASGQQGTTSAAIVISRGAGPTVALTVPGTLNRNQPATLTVTATVASGGAPISNVTVTMTDGTVLYSASAGGTFVYTFLGSGNTVLTAVATDTAGNEGRTQVSVFINP